MVRRANNDGHIWQIDHSSRAKSGDKLSSAKLSNLLGAIACRFSSNSHIYHLSSKRFAEGSTLLMLLMTLKRSFSNSFWNRDLAGLPIVK